MSSPHTIPHENVATRHDVEKTPASEIDPLDEALMASFPASEPPAFTGAAASPSKTCTPRNAAKSAVERHENKIVT